MSHTLVFPSNAQPERYGNTAALFQTDLEEPLSLDGDWEVALQDMSYVNTMKTLMHESLLLGQTNDETAYGPLEGKDQLVTYDFDDSLSQWSDRIELGNVRSKRNIDADVGRRFVNIFHIIRQRYRPGQDSVATKTTLQTKTQRKAKFKLGRRLNKQVMAKTAKQRAYDNKIERFLTIINNLAPHVWRWRYDVQRKRIRLLMKSVEGADYAFRISEDLRDILCLKHRLFLPSTHFPYGDGAEATLFLPGADQPISNEVVEKHDWEDNDLDITLLPLHRMQVKEFALNHNDLKTNDSIAAAITKAGRSYGFVTSFKDNSFVFNTDKFTSVLIHFNEELRERLRLKRDVLWKKETMTNIQIPITGPVYPTRGCGFRIYLNTLKSASKQALSWTLGQDLKLPIKHYSQPHDLCAQLNAGDKTKFTYEFGYNDKTHKFHVYVQGTTVLFLSSTLAKFMGFDKQRFYRENVVATHMNTFPTHPNHFYVYANFIRPTQVGGKPVPLLKFIPLESGAYGSTLHKEFLNKTYVPVNVSRLRHCEFGIYDDTGTLINFVGGRTVLTLHFRRLSS